MIRRAGKGEEMVGWDYFPEAYDSGVLEELRLSLGHQVDTWQVLNAMLVLVLILAPSEAFTRCCVD